MEDSNRFLKKVEDSKLILIEMITNAKKQGALNFEMLYILQDALQELSQRIENRENIDVLFRKKWNNVMGWVPRVFEDHPLLDLLRDIDKVIIEEP